MKHSLSCIAILTLCLLSITGCIARRAYVPVSREELKGSGKIYFVPLGDFSTSAVQDLVNYYKNKYGIAIETLPSVPLEPAAIDTDRHQLVAEAAVDGMNRANPNLVNDPAAILIGLTRADMYIAQYDWRFTFSWRQERKYAVVSDARMSLGAKAVPAEKLASRLRKMVTKNIGVLYFHLPQSNDPRSVLYKNVGGISELDYMGEEF
jgi:predicted Zn-dependent protease